MFNRILCIKSACIAMLFLFTAEAAELHRADVNNDGRIDMLDLIEVRNSMRLDSDDPQAFYSDVTGDVAVDLLDLVAARNNLGATRPPREFLFDLGPEGTPLASGAIRITQDTVFDEECGFGWKTPLAGSRSSADRSWDDPLRSDLIMADEPMTFIVRLPAGTYDIYVDHAYTEMLPTSMHFAIKGGMVFGATPGWTLYGSAMLENRPTAEKNALFFLAVAVEEDGLVEISFFGKRSHPYTGPWGVSYVEVRQAATHLVLHDVHLEPDKGYDMTVPVRDSDVTWVSSRFGNYQQDWDYLVEWYQDVVDDTMTTDEKVQAIIQKMFDSLALSTGPEHPVDILTAGKAICSQRATAFKSLMNTLGLPARTFWVWFMPESQYRGMHYVSTDPLAYTALFHTMAEVYYDGKWHTYNANYGALYDHPMVELIVDPTIQPVMFQPSRIIGQYFFYEAKDIIFLMTMNTWVHGSSSDRVYYTPETARSIYGDTLSSYPFRLSARRPGFAEHERVLPIVRFYRHDLNNLTYDLNAGGFLRKQIELSNLDGIKRLSSQLNVRWPDDTPQVTLGLNVNGNEIERTFSAPEGSPLLTPLILDAPAEFLVEGRNDIDMKLIEPASLGVYRIWPAQDLYLLFTRTLVSTSGLPGDLTELPMHLFWGIDVVYELKPMRFASNSIETNTLNLGSVQHSLMMLPHIEPETVRGANNLLDTFSCENSSYIQAILLIGNIPPFIKIATGQQE